MGTSPQAGGPSAGAASGFSCPAHWALWVLPTPAATPFPAGVSPVPFWASMYTTTLGPVAALVSSRVMRLVSLVPSFPDWKAKPEVVGKGTAWQLLSSLASNTASSPGGNTL